MKKIIAMFIFVFVQVVSAEEIKIGWIGPLTGDAAALGVDSLRALQLKISEAKKTRAPWV